jgi:hypothetical protein
MVNTIIYNTRLRCVSSKILPSALSVAGQKVEAFFFAHKVSMIVRNWPDADELDDAIGRQLSRVHRTC